MQGKSGYFKKFHFGFLLCLLAAHASAENSTTFNQTTVPSTSPFVGNSVKSQDSNASVTVSGFSISRYANGNVTTNASMNQTTLNISQVTATPTLQTETKSAGNITHNNNKDAAAPLNVVIIIMIAIFVFIVIASVAGGMFIMFYKPRSIPRVHLEECESEVDVTNPHHYQRNSLMVMFEHNQALDAPRLSGDAAALQKVRAAFMATADENKKGFQNVGYDKGCDA